MAEIDYYLSPISPFTYLAGSRLEEIAARHGATVAYKPVQLTRIFAETGTPQLKDRHASRRSYRLQDLARVARANGLPINVAPRHFPTNPVPAASRDHHRRRPAAATSGPWSAASCARSGSRSATSPRTRWCATCSPRPASTRLSPTGAC